MKMLYLSVKLILKKVKLTLLQLIKYLPVNDSLIIGQDFPVISTVNFDNNRELIAKRFDDFKKAHENK